MSNGRQPKITGSYMWINVGKIVRTVEIDRGLLVDLDKKNRVIGIERIAGCINHSDFTRILEVARFPKENQ